jgi:hypothetical protein
VAVLGDEDEVTVSSGCALLAALIPVSLLHIARDRSERLESPYLYLPESAMASAQ